jgi:putative spermidine/putrescine transport system ATP-binding protein
MSMCDRIAVMNDGVVEQVGSPSDIYESPENAFVANFIGTSNLLDGRVSNGRIDFGFADVAADGLAADDDATVAVRPDDFTVGEGPITAEVQNVFYMGEKLQTIATLPDGTEVTLQLDRHLDLSPGDAVALDLDPTHMHVVRR